MAHRLLALLVVIASAVAPLRSSDLGGVVVQEKQGRYRVMARFVVSETPEHVLRVLTNYERIPRYMPDVKVSLVRQRGDHQALVEQEVQKRFLMFSKRLHLLLDIREGSDSITFVDTSARSFLSYEGSWSLVPMAAGTQVTYQLEARPGFDVPQFVLMRMLRHDAADVIERLQVEIAAHAAPR